MAIDQPLASPIGAPSMISPAGLKSSVGWDPRHSSMGTPTTTTSDDSSSSSSGHSFPLRSCLKRTSNRLALFVERQQSKGNKSVAFDTCYQTAFTLGLHEYSDQEYDACFLSLEEMLRTEAKAKHVAMLERNRTTDKPYMIRGIEKLVYPGETLENRQQARMAVLSNGVYVAEKANMELYKQISYDCLCEAMWFAERDAESAKRYYSKKSAPEPRPRPLKQQSAPARTMKALPLLSSPPGKKRPASARPVESPQTTPGQQHQSRRPTTRPLKQKSAPARAIQSPPLLSSPRKSLSASAQTPLLSPRTTPRQAKGSRPHAILSPRASPTYLVPLVDTTKASPRNHKSSAQVAQKRNEHKTQQERPASKSNAPHSQAASPRQRQAEPTSQLKQPAEQRRRSSTPAQQMKQATNQHPPETASRRHSSASPAVPGSASKPQVATPKKQKQKKSVAKATPRRPQEPQRQIPQEARPVVVAPRLPQHQGPNEPKDTPRPETVLAGGYDSTRSFGSTSDITSHSQSLLLPGADNAAETIKVAELMEQLTILEEEKARNMSRLHDDFFRRREENEQRFYEEKLKLLGEATAKLETQATPQAPLKIESTPVSPRTAVTTTSQSPSTAAAEQEEEKHPFEKRPQVLNLPLPIESSPKRWPRRTSQHWLWKQGLNPLCLEDTDDDNDDLLYASWSEMTDTESSTVVEIPLDTPKKKLSDIKPSSKPSKKSKSPSETRRSSDVHPFEQRPKSPDKKRRPSATHPFQERPQSPDQKQWSIGDHPFEQRPQLNPRSRIENLPLHVLSPPVHQWQEELSLRQGRTLKPQDSFEYNVPTIQTPNGRRRSGEPSERHPLEQRPLLSPPSRDKRRVGAP